MAFTCGDGITVSEKLWGNPKQVLESGVTVNRAVTGTLLLLVEVKAIIVPTPTPGKPIFTLLFVH